MFGSNVLLLTTLLIGYCLGDLQSAGSHTAPGTTGGAYYTYGAGTSPEYYSDYDSALAEEEDRQDLGLVFGTLGSLGIATLGFIFLSAVSGSLLAPVVTGVFSSAAQRIFNSDLSTLLPELPLRSLRFAALDDRRSFESSKILSLIEEATSLYNRLSRTNNNNKQQTIASH